MRKHGVYYDSRIKLLLILLTSALAFALGGGLTGLLLFGVVCLFALLSGLWKTSIKWGEALTINERGTIGYHVRNLRKKLYSADPHHPFIIESVREVGYRFQTTS